MADHIDTASDYTERFQEEARANRVVYTGKSATECLDCGDPIPEERREAIAGVETCTYCSEKRERRLV